MTVARHWRLVFSESNGSGQIQIAELAFLDADRVDLSVGGTASATSSVSSTYDADKAFDKNTATYWDSSTGVPQTLAYDHGAPVDVRYVSVVFGPTGSDLPGPNIPIRVEHSSDGSTWVFDSALALNDGSKAINTAAEYRVVPLADVVAFDLEQGNIPFANSPIPLDLSVDVLSDAAAPYNDFEFGGNGRVVGTVKRDSTPTDIPLQRRVRLHQERGGLLVRETWSDPVTGAYEFTWIDEFETYTVLTYDHEHDYRAVVADNLTLANGGVELMP